MFSRKASRRSSKASSAGADRLPADEESVPAVEVKSDATSSAMTVVTSSGQPPMMLAQNEDDPSAHVENSLTFYYLLKRSAGRKPASTLHVYPTGGHGFGLCQASAAYHQCCDWPLHAQRFLQALGAAPHLPASPCTGVYQPDGSASCH